jgi:anthranilate 1,2-dioxygenase large subunit
MPPDVVWPRNDYSRVPFALYHDPAIYERERELIFGGKAWCYLGLEAEIPHKGDFKTSFAGDIPVLLSRDLDGQIHAVVNRCTHRGALVRREARGNARSHVCIYHRWCFGLDGRLTGIPLRKGVGGAGGISPDFDPAAHPLKPFRLGTVNGALFGTLADDVEALDDYLGPAVRAQICRVLHKPVRVLGYQRQRMHGNWKMYAENTRDNYHAGLLHSFATAFALDRATMQGGAVMDARHRHNYTYQVADSDSQAAAQTVYADAQPEAFKLKLRDPRYLDVRRERDDNMRSVITSLFPNAIFAQAGNGLAIRQIRPKSAELVEVVFTLLGYQDDDEDMNERRLMVANMTGPAGYIAMEDGEAVEIVAAATRSQQAEHSVIEIGGRGELPEKFGRATDVALRGFWSYYAELMGIEPADGVR